MLRVKAKSKPKFRVGQYVEVWTMWGGYQPTGKITKAYYMDFTFSKPTGGWYYNTTKQMGIGEDILRKRRKA